MHVRAAVLALLALAVPAAAESNLPPGVTLPVLRSQVAAGGGTAVALPRQSDGGRTVDGKVGDWGGRLPGFGGAEVYSHGELVYEDHVFDAYGADNGQDAQRLSVLDPATAAVPELYRLDPAYQYVPGEFGIPTGPLTTETHYGDQGMSDEADLSEVRLGTDARRDLWLLARTTTMKDDPGTALLVLLDTTPGSTQRDVGFGSGLKTTAGDVAVLITPHGARAEDLATGAVTPLPAGTAAYDPAGYDNAVEAKLPAALLGGATHRVGVAVAAGLSNADGTALKPLGDASSNPAGVNVANVAFRTGEPARNWWDKQQALALYGGGMDRFFTTANLDRMAAGANQAYLPGPGYHDRVFTSIPAISSESADNGILQHYGVFLPSGYDPDRAWPTQYWFHFRGGDAHIAAAAVPGIFEDMGEDHRTVVITPDGRGTSGWYVGRSQEDTLEVWRDSHALLHIDRDRTYIAGHSMGGWASYLLPIEHPDWFAAAFPASGPVTQGAYTGVDLGPQCDGYELGGDGLCYTSANGGRPRDQYVTPLVPNLKWVPYVNYQGAEDELVPVTGVTLNMKAFQDLGYRYRYYVFHGQEHYGPPVMDQWAQGAAYEHQFVRDPNPPSVTYIRSMPFEHALDEVNAGGATLSFPLDHAYWMSGLEPVDAARGVARFDGASLAIPDVPHTTLPEADAGPKADNGTAYTMVGQRWVDGDLSAAPPTRNAFTATLTGARAVTLCLRRMRLSASEELDGDVTSDHPLALTLGGVDEPADVTIDGRPVAATRAHGRLTIDVPAGHHTVVVAPTA